MINLIKKIKFLLKLDRYKSILEKEKAMCEVLIEKGNVMYEVFADISKSTETNDDAPTAITDDDMWEKASENTPITREEMDRWEYTGRMCR